MSDDTNEYDGGDVTREHHHRGGGSRGRWDDANALVKTLFGVIGIIIIAWSGFVFTVAYSSGQKNIEQDGQIKAIVERMGAIEANQVKEDVKTDRLDSKMDRVLERLPK